MERISSRDQDDCERDALQSPQSAAGAPFDSGLTDLTRIAGKYPLTTFFTLAYALSWLVFLPMILFRAPIELTVIASFGPSMAAVITNRLATGRYRAFRVFATWARTLVATAFGVSLIIVAYVVLPGFITTDPRKLNWSILTSLAVYNYSTLLGGPLGEEPGWRGYALPRLEAYFGPVRASLFLAFLWAGWHLPLFLIPGWTSSPLWIYILILIGLCIIMSYGFNLARFSVITAIVMHAAFNTISRWLAGLFKDTQPNAPIPFELVLALCGLVTGLVLVLSTSGQLAYHHSEVE